MSVIINPSTGGGGGMSIGAAVVGGTAGSVLFVGAGPVLAQDNNSFYWDDTGKTLRLGAPSALILYNVVDTISSPTNFEVGFVDWLSNVLCFGTGAGGTGTVRNLKFIISGVDKLDYGITSAGNWSFGVGTKYVLQGSSSGAITVGTAAAAGTWTLTLPTSAGTNTYVLTTDGTGVTSWAAPGGGGGMAIGGAVSGGTATSVLYVDGSGNLGQDPPHFTFDPTLNVLNVGSSTDVGAYYLDTLPAIFRVANVSGDNWFEGNSGNFTTTGSNNFGIGDSALSSLTSGTDNSAIGSFALRRTTTGGGNLAVGSHAMEGSVGGAGTSSFNAAFGFNAMQNASNCTNCVALGANALLNALTTQNCFAMGNDALRALQSGQSNIGIGSSAWLSLSAAGQDNNIGIGSSVGANATSAAGNVLIGSSAGTNMTIPAFNAIVGFQAGGSLTGTCFWNAWFGGWLGPSAAVNNTIAFSDGTNELKMDRNYITADVWSITQSTNPQALHIYKTWDGTRNPTNYERFCFDWQLTSNVARIASQAGGTGTIRIIAIDGFQKAGAPANTDIPSGTWGLINDTSGNATWLCYNAAGTIRKVQLT